MAPQEYNVVNTNDNEILVWTIISRLIYAHAPQMNGNVHSDLATLELTKREQLEDPNRRIIRLKNKLNSLEKISPLK